MNIQLGSYSNTVIPLFAESILSSFTMQLKKILKIAIIALACLAALYAIFRCCRFIATVQDDDALLPANLIIKSLHQPQTAQDFMQMGIALHLDGKAEFPDGTEMTQEQVFLKAIELDPVCSNAYNYLGAICDAKSKIKLPDGTEMTQQELFSKPSNSIRIVLLLIAIWAPRLRAGEPFTCLTALN